MKTSHGAVMSPRMERLWRYLKQERKIPLSDFSTDQCVERVYSQLEAALEAIPDDGTPENEMLYRDVRNIMRRRPAARYWR